MYNFNAKLTNIDNHDHDSIFTATILRGEEQIAL